jgi:hypothetical protein
MQEGGSCLQLHPASKCPAGPPALPARTPLMWSTGCAMEFGTSYSLFFCNTKGDAPYPRRDAPNVASLEEDQKLQCLVVPTWRNSSTLRQPFCWAARV